MEKRRSFIYPDAKSIDEYISEIETLSDFQLRILLKTILLTGVRYGEAINGFFFKDADDTLFFQCVSAKRKKIKMSRDGASYFLGRSNLLAYLQQPIWKRIKVVNLFNLDVEELEPLTNLTLDSKIVFLAEHLGKLNYNTLWKKLIKKMKKVKCKYRRNEDEELITIDEIPAFHFFRKLYASEYNKRFGLAATVDKMKWKNVNILFTYVKEY